MKYIVELEKGCFLAPWKGDPGRTLVRESAKLFNTRLGALRAANKARILRGFRNMSIQEVKSSTSTPSVDSDPDTPRGGSEPVDGL